MVWIAIALAVIVTTLPWWLSGYILGVLTVAYYFGVFSMSWDLLFGFAGEVNFGPTFLIGLGAYSAAILDAHFSMPIPICVIAGGFVALIGGLCLAVSALRLRGAVFRSGDARGGIAVAENAIVIFVGLTGSEIGIMVHDVMSIDASHNYWIALAFLIVCVIILFGLSRTAIGLIL